MISLLSRATSACPAVSGLAKTWATPATPWGKAAILSCYFLLSAQMESANILFSLQETRSRRISFFVSFLSRVRSRRISFLVSFVKSKESANIPSFSKFLESTPSSQALTEWKAKVGNAATFSSRLKLFDQIYKSNCLDPGHGTKFAGQPGGFRTTC